MNANLSVSLLALHLMHGPVGLNLSMGMAGKKEKAGFGHLLIAFEIQHTEKPNCTVKLLAVFVEGKISVH